jgi:hypothetical protein
LVSKPILPAKLELATRSAIRACDGIDGIKDQLISDPGQCSYRAARDRMVVRKACAASDVACLSPKEARAIDAIWDGPRSTRGRWLWSGVARGAPLGLLAGPEPFGFAITQPRYWVYRDPAWNWRTVTLQNYGDFFDRSVATVNPIMASNNPDLSEFRRLGRKAIVYQGYNDPGVSPFGTINYYKRVAGRLHSSFEELHSFLRLFMIPGGDHCTAGVGPQPSTDGMMDALIAWVEEGRAPDLIPARQDLPDGRIRTRPLCPFPERAVFLGHGSSDEISSFACREPV